MNIYRIGLFDGSFPDQKSATLSGDNAGKAPRNIEWVRNEYLPVTFFTDLCIDKVKNAPPGIKKIAWMIEPEGFSSTHYQKVYRMQSQFDFILSFHIDFALKFANGMWYPFGGSWISDNKMHYKTKCISMITTDKSKTSGHLIRRAIQKEIKDNSLSVDFYGRGSNPMQSKSIALKDYGYSIVIESERSACYFTEKLIDCILQGTVPIYWGAPNICMYFDTDGIIQFDTVEDLFNIIRYLSENMQSDYHARLPALENNFLLAQKFTCVEDWIFSNYPWLFKQGNENETRIA